MTVHGKAICDYLQYKLRREDIEEDAFQTLREFMASRVAEAARVSTMAREEAEKRSKEKRAEVAEQLECH